MNRKTFTAWGLATLGLAALAAAGCTPASLGYLLRDQKAKPENPLPAIKDKKEITVLVMASKSSALGMDPMFATIDREMPGLIGRQLVGDTKNDKHPIVVIDQSALEKWKTNSGGDWRTSSPSVVGKKLGADYVIDVNVNSMSIFQPTLAREYCKGLATVDVTVFDTAQADKVLYQYTHNSHQPERSVEAMPPNSYRKWFTERLAKEIAWRNIPHDSNERLAMIK